MMKNFMVLALTAEAAADPMQIGFGVVLILSGILMVAVAAKKNRKK